ncbi:EscU/YscU/HrcU family type III secretion system export apparatus switch protein [Bacillota bacterium LX-D]|nr:EscU/YscU/HrcU family type III secretion system export apparatus switch protein [Bacillota bacterium LX-D]
MRDKKERKVAAAISFDPQQDSAPKVVAKGYGEIADKIINKARELGVPIYTEPDVARVLIGLELNQEIPPELYEAVAAILAYIMTIDKKAKTLQQLE